MSKVKLIVIPVVIFVVALVALYLYLSLKKSPLVPAFAPPSSAPKPAAGTQTLGAKIYDQTADPIKGKVPTVSPVTNPVQGLYKNPFGQ